MDTLNDSLLFDSNILGSFETLLNASRCNLSIKKYKKNVLEQVAIGSLNFNS